MGKKGMQPASRDAMRCGMRKIHATLLQHCLHIRIGGESHSHSRVVCRCMCQNYCAVLLHASTYLGLNLLHLWRILASLLFVILLILISDLNIQATIFILIALIIADLN